ncbi:hypothetical protein D3C72_1734090 [compost metagenome]
MISGGGARRLLMISGTFSRTMVVRSACQRVFSSPMTWLTPKGAIFASGFSAAAVARRSRISAIQSTRVSCGRAFSAGKAPMMPLRHCSTTRSRVEAMNSGDPMIGRRSLP